MNKVKKLTVALIVLVIGLFSAFAFTACGGDDKPTIIDLSKKATLTVADIEYGSAPTETVTYKEQTLLKGTDYEITFGDYSQLNEAVPVTVTFIGKYKGSIIDTFAVVACDLSNVAKVEIEDIEYGEVPTATVKNGETTLTLGTDYEIDYGDYSALSDSITAIVTFKGNYTGSINEIYAVVPKTVTPTVTCQENAYTYNGKEHKPAVTVSVDGQEIDENGYTVVYKNNINAGTATATVTLSGNYRGTATAQFTIGKGKIEKPEVTTVDFTYDGDVQKFSIGESDDYIVIGNLQSEVGAYDVVVAIADGANYTWSDGTSDNLTYKFNILPYDASEAVLTINDVVVGEKPEYELTLDGFTFVESDYTLDLGSYDAISDAVTATVTFGGNFVGSTTTTYAVKDVTEKIDVLIDFNYDILDRANGRPVKMAGSHPDENYGTGANGSGAINLTAGRKTFVHIENSPLGTEDFTAVMTVKFDMADIADGTNEGNAIFETGLHVAYDCNGNNTACPTKGCPSLHKDVVKLALTRSGSSYKLRYQFGNNDVNVYGINYTLTADEFAQISENGVGKWFTVAIAVDRRVSVVGNIETAIGYLYLNGKLLASKEVEYEIDNGNYYVLGDGNIYLGGNNTWTSGGGVKFRDRVMDDFALFKVALNENQISEKVPAYLTTQSVLSDWIAPKEVAFGFVDLVDGAYSTTITLSGSANLTGATLKNAPSGITLSPVDGQNGSYTLAFTADSIKAMDNGTTLTISLNGVDKHIEVIYATLDAIYLSDETINFYDFNVSDDGYSKSFMVTADEDGKIKIAGVTFTVDGNAYDKITAGSKAGEYIFSLTKEEASAFTSVTVKASYAGYTNEFVITKNAVASSINEYTAISYVDGTTDYTDLLREVSIGTGSITIGFNLTIPSTFVPKSSDYNRDIFATSAERSGGVGIRVGFKSQKSGFYQYCLQVNGLEMTSTANKAPVWYTFDKVEGGSRPSGVWKYTGTTVAFVIEIDRSVEGYISIKTHLNGFELAPYADALDADIFTAPKDLNMDGTNETPMMSFGNGGTGSWQSNASIKDGFGFSDIIVNKSLCEAEMTAELLARQAK